MNFSDAIILHVPLPLACALASQKGQPPPPLGPHDPKGWVTDGLPVDETSPAFLRRNKHKGGRKFSLTSDLLERLPKVNQQGLQAVRDFVGGKGPYLPFQFFEECFPREAQDIVLQEVRDCWPVFFC